MDSQANGRSADEDEIMRYGILGEDETSTPEKLEKYTGEVDWSYLRPHFENGALLWLDASLSMTEVGAALTSDNAEKVEAWKKSGDLITPSEPHAAYWEESGARFTALVVSPFVLIQSVEESDTAE